MDRDMEILVVTVKTKNSENTVDLNEDLRIDSENINEAFCEQPAKFAWWATVAAQAKSLVDRKKLEIEAQDDYLKKTLTGELDYEVRTSLEMNGEKVTESKVTNGIYSHETYKSERDKLFAMKQELLDLQAQATVLDIAKESMIQRKDALISLGAQLRLEGSNTELSMKKLTANEVIGRNRASKSR